MIWYTRIHTLEKKRELEKDTDDKQEWDSLWDNNRKVITITRDKRMEEEKDNYAFWPVRDLSPFYKWLSLQHAKESLEEIGHQCCLLACISMAE